MYRILISAYGCEPGKGSEPGVGWHWVMEMAKNNELWVITRSNNREAIENALTVELKDRVHFIYYDLSGIIRKIKRKEKGLYPYYFLWQLGAYRRVKPLVTDVNFDFCMHLSFGSMWVPTFMYKLPIPFIWGPIGGGEAVPFGFIKILPWKNRIPQYIRYLLIRFLEWNPLFMGPCRKASAIIARTVDSKAVFPAKYQFKTSVMLETGMTREDLQRYPLTAKNDESADDASREIELIYVGRLVPLKNIETAIHALAIIGHNHRNFRLALVGDGPLKDRLTALAKKLNLQEQIRFLGAVSQQRVIQQLQKSQIFLFPSLKEGGSWALIEAMSVGLPVICLDTSGMHVITDDSCAIRIPPTTPNEVVNRMAEAIIKLGESSPLRKRMGENAKTRIRENFLWSQKGLFMESLLKELKQTPLQVK